jgi:predicted phage-related endonuclease
MADLTKIQRSRDMILELHNSLMDKVADDETIKSHIHVLERSIKLIDNKIEEFKNKEATIAAGNAPSQNNQADDSLAA